ncbi:ABC transporter permease [Lysinibacillus capsici]|uniref:ABC transporter permease n=1 Tax=Lysinibacillus capsici TaxID=2115968 RepID=UPI002E1A8B3D|nr:ABC transporter permease [Lysinibacillus capsici]
MIRALVDEAIILDRRIKEDKKRLDEIKAALTAHATAEMDNKNLKYHQVYGETGRFNVFFKEKFEIDRFDMLRVALGELADGKISKKYEVKYDVDSKFKAALIALYKGDYSDAVQPLIILMELGLSATQIKGVTRKLKGDYLSDKKLLESVGVQGDLEEELDAIRQYKNWEMVNRFFGDLEDEQIIEIKRAIFVEDGISVGLDYEK